MPDLLPAEYRRFADRHNLGRQLGAAAVVAAANALGDPRFQALSFRSGRLTLGVGSAVLRRLVERDEATIVAAINARYPEPVVKRLAFRIVRPD